MSFFPDASGRDIETLWADHKRLQPIQEMFTVNRMFIYLSGFDLNSHQQNQNMKQMNNPNAKYVFLATHFGFIFLDGVITNIIQYVF